MTANSFGQYVHRESPVHRMDARVKIAAFLIYLIVLFSLKNLLSVMGMLILCLILFPVAKVPAKVTLRNFKPIVPIVIITVIINLLLIKQGDILVFRNQSIIFLRILNRFSQPEHAIQHLIEQIRVGVIHEDAEIRIDAEEQRV